MRAWKEFFLWNWTELVFLSVGALLVAACLFIAWNKANYPMLPMPPDGKELHDHMQSCETCSQDGMGSLCEVGFELVIKGFEGNESFKFNMVNGWNYIGEPIAGWNWNVKKQEWERP